jgi:GYD domain
MAEASHDLFRRARDHTGARRVRADESADEGHTARRLRVSVVHAPDEKAMVAYTLAVARLGNFRTTTLRAWSADEMREIVSRLPR